MLMCYFFQVTVNGDSNSTAAENDVEKVTEALAELQFEEEDEETTFYSKVDFLVENKSISKNYY